MLPYFGRSFLRMHHLSNLLRREMLHQFNKNLATIDMANKEGHFPRVNDNAFYQMRVAVNDNGNVKVKTMSKEPGKEWNIKVEQYDSKDQAPSLEQGEFAQKKPETLEQGKVDQVKIESQTKTQSQESQQNVEPEMKQEGSEMKDTVQKTSETVQKSEPQKIETEKEMNASEKKEKVLTKEVPTRSPERVFDEFDAIFDRVERDFENSFRRSFGMFENPRTPRYRSPFDEIDAMFAEFEKDFMYPFRRSFDYYDPFYIEDISEQPKVRKSEGQGQQGNLKEGKESAPSKSEEQTQSSI